MKNKTTKTLGVGQPRVLMILNRYHPMVGGAERQCELLCETLSDRISWVGVLTHRYAPELPREASVSDVAVIRLGNPTQGIRAPVSFYLSLARYLWCNAREIDLVHCHTAGFTGLWVGLLGRVLRKPVLLKLTALGELADQVKPSSNGAKMVARIKLALRHTVAKAALYAPNTYMVALTREGAEEARGAGISRVEIIPNGVRADSYKPNGPRPPLNGRPVILGYAGRYTAEKGTDTLAEAFEQLLKEGERVQLCLIGSAERQLNPSIQNLQRLKANFPAQIDIGGAVPNTLSFLQGLDIYVSASTYEGLPNAVLEALACGLPCVLSDIDAHREMARLNPSAHIEFFPPDDPAACAVAIRHCASIRPLPSSHLSPTLHMHAVADRYFALYRSIISAANREPSK